MITPRNWATLLPKYSDIPVNSLHIPGKGGLFKELSCTEISGVLGYIVERTTGHLTGTYLWEFKKPKCIAWTCITLDVQHSHDAPAAPLELVPQPSLSLSILPFLPSLTHSQLTCVSFLLSLDLVYFKNLTTDWSYPEKSNFPQHVPHIF